MTAKKKALTNKLSYYFWILWRKKLKILKVRRRSNKSWRKKMVRKGRRKNKSKMKDWRESIMGKVPILLVDDVVQSPASYMVSWLWSLSIESKVIFETGKIAQQWGVYFANGQPRMVTGSIPRGRSNAWALLGVIQKNKTKQSKTKQNKVIPEHYWMWPRKQSKIKLSLFDSYPEISKASLKKKKKSKT